MEVVKIYGRKTFTSLIIISLVIIPIFPVFATSESPTSSLTEGVSGSSEIQNTTQPLVTPTGDPSLSQENSSTLSDVASEELMDITKQPKRPDAIDVVDGKATYGDPTTSEGKSTSASTAPSPMIYTPETAHTSSQSLSKPEADLSTGALTYGYQFDVPEGRNGLTPNLNLSYNNQGDQFPSYFGDRFTLSIPYIQRLNKTGSDKLYTSTTFTSSVDGELVQVGSSSSYVPKVEKGNFLKYDFDDTLWTVTDKKGTVYVFGKTALSRQDDPNDPTHVYKWMIEEIKDTNSNTIQYSYLKDNGEIYPDTISYSDIYTVSFTREPYSGVTSVSPYVYYPSFRVTTSYRIKNVTISVNNDWVKKYDLAYTVGDAGYRTLLQSIIVNGKDSVTNSTTSLPPTTFEYKAHGEMGWDPTQTSSYVLPDPAWMMSYSEPNLVQMQDFNGDTYPEVALYQTGGTPKVDLNNTVDGWTDSNGGWDLPIYFKDTDAYFRDYGTRIMDVNGDMYNDLVRSYAPNDNVDPTNTKVYLNNGYTPGWTENTTMSVPLAFIFGSGMNADNGVRIADINGDGFPDILKAYLIEDNESSVNHIPAHIDQKVYLGNGNGWDSTPSSTWGVPFPFIDQNPSGPEVYTYAQLVDINGDHLPDIIWRSFPDSMIMPDGRSIYSVTLLNNGHGWEESWPNWQTLKSAGIENTLYRRWGLTDGGVKESDMNGDNLPDLFQSKSQAGYSSLISFFNLNSANPESPYNQEVQINAPEPFANPTGSTNPLLFADVNADGMNDMLIRNLPNVPISHTSLGRPNNFTDTLTKITTPTGGTYTLGYKRSNKYRNADDTLMNPHLPIIIDTINTITETDPVTVLTDTTTYMYSDGVYYYTSPSDRKFGGFALVSSTDALGNVTKLYFHQGNTSDTSHGEYNDSGAKIGQLYRREIYDSNGQLYQRDITKWDSTSLSPNSDFIFPRQTLTESYDGNSTHRDTAEEYTYDTYGNITTNVTWGEVIGSDDGTFTDTGNDKTTENITYVENTSLYIVGLPYHDIVLDQNSTKVRESNYYYDALALGSVDKGNQTKSEDWVNASTYTNHQKTYNDYGLVTSDIDPRGKITTYSYDSYNLYPTTVTDPLTHTMQYVYDYSSGKPQQITDQNGFMYKTIYDGLDRVLEQKIPGFTVPTNLYTKTGYVYTDTAGGVSIKRMDYLGSTTLADSYQYFDGFGRLIQERKEAETPSTFNVRDIIYMNTGLVQKQSLPYTSSGSSKTSPTSASSLYSTYTYDVLKRPLTIVDAVGTTRYTYDDWKTTVTDAKKKIKKYSKDAYDNLVSVDEVNGGSTYTTTYEWSPNKTLMKVTDALGNIRNFTYDGLGQRLTAEDLHSPTDTTFGTWTYAYDDAGNVSQAINPRAQTTKYTYDDANQILTEDYTGGAGTEITYTYGGCTNGVAKLCSVTMTSGANTSYTYDSNGNVVSEAKTINGTTYTTSYTYDRQGNVVILTYPDNAQVKYTYNTANLLEKIERQENGGAFTNVISDINYSRVGEPKIIVYADGTTTTNSYDVARLYRLSNKTTVNALASALQNMSYTYDASGNITKIIDASNTNSAKTAVYTYDDLYRLTSATITAVPTGQNTYAQTFTYDALGNMLTGPLGTYLYEGNTGTLKANPHAPTSVNGAANTYDNDGNLKTNTKLTNSWNYKGQLTKTVMTDGTTIYNYYDYKGDRIWYKVGASSTYYVNKYYNINPTAKEIKQIYANDQLVATIEKSNSIVTPYYIHTDNLLGSNVITDSTGKVAQLLDYYPYGDIRLNERATSLNQKNKFGGHQYDTASDLNYFGARYYDAKTGRFISEDSMFWQLPQELLLDPQQQNSYSYARNNPINLIDPNGQLSIGGVIKAMSTFILGKADIAHAPSSIDFNYQRADNTILSIPMKDNNINSQSGKITGNMYSFVQNQGVNLNNTNHNKNDGLKATSLEGVRQDTVLGAIDLKQNCSCDTVITGGTENGHPGKGEFSHSNGWKLDFRPGSLDSFIPSNFSSTGNRGGDNAPGYKDDVKNGYWRESNHWDVLYNNHYTFTGININD